MDQHCSLVEKKPPVMSAEAQGSEFTERNKAKTNVKLPNFLMSTQLTFNN